MGLVKRTEQTNDDCCLLGTMLSQSFPCLQTAPLLYFGLEFFKKNVSLYTRSAKIFITMVMMKLCILIIQKSSIYFVSKYQLPRRTAESFWYAGGTEAIRYLRFRFIIFVNDLPS